MPFHKLNSHGDLMMRHQIVDALNSLEPSSGQRSAYIAGYMEALRRVALAMGIGYLPPFDADAEAQRSNVMLWDNYQ